MCSVSERDVVHDEKELETFYSTDRRQQELCLACESFTNYIVLLFLLKGFLFKSKKEIRRKKRVYPTKAYNPENFNQTTINIKIETETYTYVYKKSDINL